MNLTCLSWTGVELDNAAQSPIMTAMDSRLRRRGTSPRTLLAS